MEKVFKVHSDISSNLTQKKIRIIHKNKKKPPKLNINVKKIK